jgi:hypothetical protein
MQQGYPTTYPNDLQLWGGPLFRKTNNIFTIGCIVPGCSKRSKG